MNDEEIMRKFNEQFSDEKYQQQKQEVQNVEPYKATANLNVANPQVTQTNANQQVNLNNQGTLNNQVPDMMKPETNNYASYNTYGDNVSYNYVPSYNTKKKKQKASITISPEMKMGFIIVALLFVFVLIMPTIYDLIRNISIR